VSPEGKFRDTRALGRDNDGGFERFSRQTNLARQLLNQSKVLLELLLAFQN